MAVFKCKMCGGNVAFDEGATVGVCEYCGTKQTLPRLDDDRRANLYDRANHFRRNNEFDKAEGIYEQILSEDRSDAEAYWSLVLCRYGIEYVEDPSTHKRIPTVNRAQFTSIFDDENYRSALQYADSCQQELYTAEANAINEIQKGILAISRKEEPFDIFICYKETDAAGRRTPDSVLAGELYGQLTKEGFKVFFSRITLEDKLGTAYEPYIFAALHSAKVMVVLGTKPEYFNAVWVKNEWSRFLALCKNDSEKALIPAYRDMDPYDLPEEFSHLQAQDMAKLGFMQDLVRGIRKIIGKDERSAPAKEVPAAENRWSGSGNAAPLLKRAFMFLEDGDFARADEFCEQVLNIDPENADAYLGKLMAELQVRRRENLKDQKKPFAGSGNYQKAIRFGDGKLKSELTGAIDYINERNKNEKLDAAYREATTAMNAAASSSAYKNAAKKFHELGEYKNSASLEKECTDKAEITLKKEKKKKIKILITVLTTFIVVTIFAILWVNVISPLLKYNKALKLIENKNYEEGYAILTELGDYSDAQEQILIGKYTQALELIDNKKHEEGYAILTELGDYSDAQEQIQIGKYAQATEALDAGNIYDAAIKFRAISEYKDAYEQSMTLWNKIADRKTIAAGGDRTVGLKSNGTVVATGYNYSGQCNVSDWRDIVAVSAGGSHTVGLKSNGTVVATGYNDDGRCDVSEWRDIVAVSAGDYHTVGLKSDGTVVATGGNDDGQCNVSDWRDIVAVSTGDGYTVGLRSDGTVVAVGDNDDGQCDVSEWREWRDIVAVSAGENHTVGLKSDGTVVATGYNRYGQCDVSEWRDIVAVSAGDYHTVGLKSDGTVVAMGHNEYGQCRVSGWRDIVAIAAGRHHTALLKSDGTVVAVGRNDNGQRNVNVSEWQDIKIPKK